MTEVNIPLLRKGLEWVEEQDALPEIDREWNQRDWITSPLFRSLALVYQRGRFSSPEAHKRAARQVAPHCGTAYCFAGYIAQLENERYANQIEVDGVDVGDFAQEVLGLTQDQANELFEGDNTAEMIREICERFAGQRL